MLVQGLGCHVIPDDDLPVHPNTRAVFPNGDRSAALDSTTPAPDDPPISSGKTPQSAKTNYVFVDLENVRPHITFPDGRPVKLKIFVGTKQGKVPWKLFVATLPYGHNAEYIQTGPGKNSLDFHIAYYIGEIVGSMGGRISDVFFHIISKDRGFEPLIAHLRAKGIFCHRSEGFERLPIDGIFPPGSNCTIVSETPIRPAHGSSRNKSVRKKAKPVAPTSERPDKLQLVMKNLAKRGKSKPRSLRTLHATIKSLFENQMTDSEGRNLIDQLVNKGVLTVTGTTVSYCTTPLTKKTQLPSPPQKAIPTNSLLAPASKPSLQSLATPRPAFDPSDPAAAATAYREFIKVKLKGDIPSLATRKRIYAVLDVMLRHIAQNRKPMRLADLSTSIANSLASTLPGVLQASVFELLNSLLRMQAFETEPSKWPFLPKIIASNKADDATWDDLFILNCVQVLAREKADWPVIHHALSAVFEVSADSIGRITSPKEERVNTRPARTE